MQEEKFFDRKTYLEILEKRICGFKQGFRQNLAIIGDESVGKTSIILRFLSKFYDNQIVILYLEIRPDSLFSFIHRFIGVLLYNFLSNSSIPLEEDLDFLIQKAQRFIPKTTEKIKFILNNLNKSTKPKLFAETLLLCESLYLETGKSCVVIFDEFINLETMGIKYLYREWSRLLLLEKHTMYIIVSSLKFKTQAILSKDLSLLFGNFEVISVEPFDIKTSEEYLDNRLTGLNLSQGLKGFLVHFTGGYPLYLEIITDALLKAKDISLPELLENLLFDTSGILNQKFSNYLKRFLDKPFGQDCLSILYLISCGHNKLKDIIHLLSKPKKEVNNRINYLLDVDTVTKSGDFLKINDRVFGFWLRFVYQEKLNTLTFDAKNQKAIFRKNIEEMIRDFLASWVKPISQRLTELLHLFSDETIQIEKKRLKLNRFREIKPLQFNYEKFKEGLIGRSQDTLWILAIKADELNEQDIAEFSKECKKYRHKLQRKIIVTYNHPDVNARLRALEEKVITWDLNSLNQILDYFSQPRIII
ncbi:MAG: hypothetical protein NC928_02475 [Candidatus Omnitrophica bacterium]|nr:hypothetical protein [Candidatus Omnitrophota bacterium]